MDRTLFRLIAHLIVFDESGRVLLLRRAGTGFLDGHYALPGGHVDRGETVIEAARRECREETGIEAKQLEPVVVMPYSGGVDFVFEVSNWTGSPTIGEPDKCDDLVFAPVDALPQPTAAFVGKALELREQGVWYHQFD